VKRLLILLVLASVCVVLGSGRVRRTIRRLVSRPAEHPPVGEIYKIATNLYVIPGGGGTTAAFVTAHGVVLVDTKYPDRYQALLDELRKVTDKPVTHVINTHHHFDHTGSNALLPEGTEIVMHENAAVEMEKMRLPTTPVRPVRTYKDKLTLFDGADTVEVNHFGAAHTNGDSFVVFREAHAVHAGDVFPSKLAPIVNHSSGGRGATFGKTIGMAVKSVEDGKLVISGHGGVYTWVDFADYGEFNHILLEEVRNGVSLGKNNRQIVAELKLPEKFRDYKLGRLFVTIDGISKSLN